MADPEKMYRPGFERQRLDQYKSFFTPTLADGHEDFYKPIRPCLGSELSTANLEREDLKSYVTSIKTTVEMMYNGQEGLGIFIETIMTGELKLTDSIEARVLDNIFSNKMEYSQTQTVHEYQHPVEKKKGFFGRNKGER